MYLLFGNKCIEDIIDSKKLEQYLLLSRGMFKVDLILSNSPEGWSGLRGRITTAVLQKWFIDVKITTPTSTSPISPISTSPISFTSQHSIEKRYTKRKSALQSYNLPKPLTIIDE